MSLMPFEPNYPDPIPFTAPGGPSTPTGGGGGSTPDTSRPDTSAYDELRALLDRVGLPNAQDIIDALTEGAVAGESATQVQIRLQATESWKQRFQGNEIRRQQGLNVLSVQEYLALENEYAAVLHNAGMPDGFYDDPSDFAGFIGRGVSVSEVSTRVNLASDIAHREDPAILAELQRRGIPVGALAAYVLDPDRAAPLIRRDLEAVKIGAAGRRAGLDVSLDQSAGLAARGVSEAEAVNSFGTAAQLARNVPGLSDIHGIQYTASDAVSEVFDGDAGAAERRRRIAGAERAAFSGSGSFGVNQTSTTGQF